MKNINYIKDAVVNCEEQTTIESLLKRLNKTTIYVIVNYTGAILLFPKVIGNTIKYNLLNGHCEHDGDKKLNIVECSAGRRVDSIDAMRIIDQAVMNDHTVNEILVEGYSELEPSGELDFSVEDERYKLIWR